MKFCQTDCACAIDTESAKFNSTYTLDEQIELKGYNNDSNGQKNTE